MSDDARQLIDNPYRASHTPIYVGDVNVTDLMARAWDRGFAAGDERLRAMLGKVPREQLGRIMQEVAATPNAPKADVRRWTPAYGPNGSCCYENENGDYVLARDYDDLAAASPDERLREALDNLLAAVTDVERCGEAGLIEALDDAMNDAADLLAAADRDSGDVAIERLGNAVIEANRRGPIPPVSDDPDFLAADREKPDEPHTQDCQDAMFMHHAATGGDMECTCRPPVSDDPVNDPETDT